jgi:hypothetical protein
MSGLTAANGMKEPFTGDRSRGSCMIIGEGWGTGHPTAAILLGSAESDRVAGADVTLAKIMIRHWREVDWRRRLK